MPDGTDAVILELGANDALRGIDPKVTRANLEKIIASLKARNIPILLAGMRSPANWGDDYSDDFDAHLPRACARATGSSSIRSSSTAWCSTPSSTRTTACIPTGKGVAEIVKRMLPSVEELIARAQAQARAASKS